jgi:hypothetical protein
MAVKKHKTDSALIRTNEETLDPGPCTVCGAKSAQGVANTRPRADRAQHAPVAEACKPGCKGSTPGTEIQIKGHDYEQDTLQGGASHG